MDVGIWPSPAAGSYEGQGWLPTGCYLTEAARPPAALQQEAAARHVGHELILPRSGNRFCGSIEGLSFFVDIESIPPEESRRGCRTRRSRRLRHIVMARRRPRRMGLAPPALVQRPFS